MIESFQESQEGGNVSINLARENLLREYPGQAKNIMNLADILTAFQRPVEELPPSEIN